MKKYLVSAIIAAAASSSAMALDPVNIDPVNINGPHAFFWANVPINNVPVTIANVPQAVLAPGETLVGVQVSFAGSVHGRVIVNPSSTTTATATLIGNHILAFGSFNPVDTDAVNVSSPPTVSPAGVDTVLTTASAPTGPGGTTVLNLASFIGGGTIPLTLRFNGALGVNINPPTDFTSDPSVLSSGAGNITYLITTGNIPEAETYVAGLALIGLAGFGAYRRSIRA